MTLYVYTSRIGNIFDDCSLDPGKAGHDAARGQTVPLSRADMAKSRHLARTRSGTEVGISLGRGVTLRHGDVLRTKNAKDPHVVVSQTPEKVALIRFPEQGSGGGGGGSGGNTNGIGDRACHTVPFLLGHVIGNMHRPVAIGSMAGGMVASVPIQDDSEVDTLGRMLAAISRDIRISMSEEIFTPHEGADVHGHG